MDNKEMKLRKLSEEMLSKVTGGLDPLCSFQTLGMVSDWKHSGLSVEKCAQKLYDMGYDESTGNTLPEIVDWLYSWWGDL